MTHTIADKNSVISSITLDQIIAHIWDADAQGVLKLPKKLDRPASYGSILKELFYAEDIAYITGYIQDLNLSQQQLIALDALARWLFVNSVSKVRAAVGLIGTVVFRDEAESLEPVPLDQVEEGRSIIRRFTSESVSVISHVFRQSSVNSAVCAKIPMRPYDAEYATLSTMNDVDRDYGLSEEREQLKHWMATTNAKSEIYPEAGTRLEFAARRLIQVIHAIAGYKNASESDALRTLISNIIHVSTIVRVVAGANTPLLSRLASDVSDYFHSLDRLLGSGCGQARLLIERMERGDLLYADALAIGRQRHQAMAMEFPAAITLFSYMLKVAAAHLRHEDILDDAISALMRFTNAEQVYLTVLSQFGQYVSPQRKQLCLT